MAEEVTFNTDYKLWWPNAEKRDAGKDIKHSLWHVRTSEWMTQVCPQRRVVVQAGGHAGVWPRKLSESFGKVITFEPHPHCYTALVLNTAGCHNVESNNAALGATTGRVRLNLRWNSSVSFIDPNGEHGCEMIALDAMELPILDALFLDVESHEAPALRGAAATIKRCRPLIQVEMLPRSRDEITDVMEDLGYEFLRRVGRDCVFKCKK